MFRLKPRADKRTFTAHKGFNFFAPAESGWFDRAEPKGVRIRVDPSVSEAGGLQSSGKRLRIYQYHRVKYVEYSKEVAVHAIRTREDSTRPQHSSDLGQQAILEGFRLHMMEHRKGNGAIEACRRE